MTAGTIFAKARQIPGFVDARASSYTVAGQARAQPTCSDPQAKIEPAEGDLIKIHYGQRETWLRVQHIDKVARLVRQRVAFIRERQQVRHRRSPIMARCCPTIMT